MSCDVLCNNEKMTDKYVLKEVERQKEELGTCVTYPGTKWGETALRSLRIWEDRMKLKDRRN